MRRLSLTLLTRGPQLYLALQKQLIAKQVRRNVSPVDIVKCGQTVGRILTSINNMLAPSWTPTKCAQPAEVF